MGIRKKKGSSSKKPGTLNTQAVPQPKPITSPLSRSQQIAAQLASAVAAAKTRAASTAAQPTPVLQVSPSNPGKTSTIATFPAIVPTKATKPSDVVRLDEGTLKNSAFELTSRNGISSYRPEVIAVTTFEPLFYDNSMETPTGKLLGLNAQLEKIRWATFLEILKSMKGLDQTKYNDALQSSKSEFDTEIDRARQLVGFYDRYATATAAIKSGFDLGHMSPSAFDTASWKTLKGVFESYLQYDSKEFSSFSNTKIFLQLCSDFKAILENYSFSLLDIEDTDRIDDLSPTVIDTTYSTTSTEQFSFTLDSVKALQNASKPESFGAIVKSLPKSPTDRIKLLSVLLSKELRASRVLGSNPNLVTTLQTRYGYVVGSMSPYSAMLGSPGGTIFDEPSSNTADALVKLAYITDDSGITVLPFEDKFIDISGQQTTTSKTYVPGSSYYTDSILNIASNGSSFNTKPVVGFVDAFTKSVSNVTYATKQLLELTDTSKVSDLAPIKVVDRILTAVQSATTGLHNVQSVNLDQGIMVSVLKLSKNDTVLRNMLFQFFILSSISQQTSVASKDIVSTLGRELGNTRSLSYVKSIASLNVDLNNNNGTNTNTYSIYMQALAQDIEDRVLYVANGHPIPEYRSLIPTGEFVPNKFSGTADLNLILPDQKKRQLYLKDGDVKNVMMRFSSVKTTVTMATEFLSILDELTRNASTGAGAVYLLSPGTGWSTRLSNISSSVLALFVFEIMCASAEAYGNVTFGSSKYQDKLLLVVDAGSTKSVSEAIATTLTVSPTPTATVPGVEAYRQQWNMQLEFLGRSAAYQTARLGTQALRERVLNEETVIGNFVHVLESIAKSLNESKQLALTTFTQQSLASFIALAPEGTVNVIKNPAQIATTKFLLESTAEAVARADDSLVVPDDYYLSEQSLQLLKACLAQPKFGFAAMADERLRVLSVGLPDGMSRQLSDRLLGTSSTVFTATDFQKKQQDVVEVRVYKRDSRYPDLVFLPKRFVFDLSLFLTPQEIIDLVPGESETFSQLTQRVGLTDYSSPGENKRVTIDSLQNDQAYSFLTQDQKRLLFASHVESTMLGLYVNMLTDLQMTEDGFSESSFARGERMSKKIDALTRQFLQTAKKIGLPPVSFVEILQNQSIPDEAQDVVRLMTMSPLGFEPLATVRDRVTAPRLFERVLNLPVGSEGFDLDLDTTVSTESGKRALRQAFVLDSIVEDRTQGSATIKSTGDDIVFADFFVVVEPLNLRK